MTSRWPLAVLVAALAFILLGGARRAEAKKLEDCPVYQALTQQRQQSSTRSASRYSAMRRGKASTADHITNGLKNVLVSPLEIPLTMRRSVVENGLLTGTFGGSIQGFGFGLERMVSGVAEVMAAPIPGIEAPSYRRSLGGPVDSRGGTFFSNVLNNAINQRK
jgi:putative exosortase-associated protein (TIGR04073 family)